MRNGDDLRIQALSESDTRYSDNWDFWKAQLEHQNDPSLPEPETTPGTPHQGFFKLRVRTTEYAPVLGKRRNKVTTTFKPVAIWFDGGWRMLVGFEDFIRDADRIDDTFSRCCRLAIDYDEYERLKNENKRSDQRDFNGAGESAG